MYAEPANTTIIISSSIPGVSPATMPAMRRFGRAVVEEGIVQYCCFDLTYIMQMVLESIRSVTHFTDYLLVKSAKRGTDGQEKGQGLHDL